jgi:head-tail adaptor
MVMAGGAFAPNRRFTLEAAQRLPDGAGGVTETWVTLGDVWGVLESGIGREAERDTLPVGAVRAKITIRAVPPGRPSRPQPGQRLREGGRVFRILAVTEAEREARFLTCHTLQEEIPA